jgi:ornithine carbamoyltransferase
MNLALTHRLQATDTLTTADRSSLADAARSMQQARARGSLQLPLKGKHIALLCDDPACEEAERFTVAANALGARVTRLKTDVLPRDDADDMASRVLGRLYDAVECDALDAEQALRLQKRLGVPVYNGLIRRGEAIASALGGLAAGVDAASLMQAALCQTLV